MQREETLKNNDANNVVVKATIMGHFRKVGDWNAVGAKTQEVEKHHRDEEFEVAPIHFA